MKINGPARHQVAVKHPANSVFARNGRNPPPSSSTASARPEEGGPKGAPLSVGFGELTILHLTPTAPGANIWKMPTGFALAETVLSIDLGNLGVSSSLDAGVFDIVVAGAGLLIAGVQRRREAGLW